MSTPRTITRAIILDGASATGTGNTIEVRDFKNVQIVLSTSGSADLTAQIAGSFADNRSDVDFTSPASITNEWDYIASFNLQNPTSIIPGDTGVVYSGTDAVEQLLVNVDGINFITVDITAYSAGTLNATLIGYSND